MGLLTLRSASYVGGLTSVVLETFGNRTDVLVSSLIDQPGFSPVRKRSDPTWVPSRESGSCKGTGPFAVASRPLPGGTVLESRPPTCAAGTGAFPRSAIIRDSE